MQDKRDARKVRNKNIIGSVTCIRESLLESQFYILQLIIHVAYVNYIIPMTM